MVHFEIPCDNPEKTMEFFKEVFGWKFEKFGNEEYWSAITGNDGSPGIIGGILKKRDPNQSVANSIEVPDVDAYVTKIEKAGGNIVVPKMPIPSIGWLAYFKDPDGNIHGLFQEDRTAVYIPNEQVS